jgi:hypothetical protein
MRRWPCWSPPPASREPNSSQIPLSPLPAKADVVTENGNETYLNLKQTTQLRTVESFKPEGGERTYRIASK